MCESFPKNVMAGCLNICTTQRYFEHWLCDVQQITCAYSSTEIFTHSRIFITYELTYQSTKVSQGTLSVCFCVLFCVFLGSFFWFFRVSLFALCVCLKVPPLLCFMFPCLQFVFVCQFHPCCVSRPSCFSMFGPGTRFGSPGDFLR